MTKAITNQSKQLDAGVSKVRSNRSSTSKSISQEYFASTTAYISTAGKEPLLARKLNPNS